MLCASDQWERIKDLLPGRDGYVGVTAKDNRLFALSGAVSVPLQVSLGETCLLDLAIFEWYTRALAVGRKPECGSKCFST